MFDTYPDEGGFCLLSWVMAAGHGDCWSCRVALFLVLCLPLGLVLNIAWLIGIGRR